MTLNLDLWRHALTLALDEPANVGEAASLANALGVVEEALPYLMLRRNGFADCPRLRGRIEEVAAAAPGAVRRGRRPEILDAVRRAAAAAELRTALKALIDSNLEPSPLHRGVDDAERNLVELSPAGPFDAPWRFGPGEWPNIKAERSASRPRSRTESKAPPRRKERDRRPHRPKGRRR